MDPLTISALISAGGSIAGGLLGKKQKAPQIPNVQLPGLGDYEWFPRIENEIKRLRSQPGYGPQFADKATSPIAASMRRDFKNITSPFISNQYSARGLSRSNLAADAQGKAEGDVESDIGNIFSQLFQLNEIQKETQQGQATDLENQQFDRAINRHRAQAGIDMGVPVQQAALDQTAGEQTALNRASGAEMGLSLASLFKPQGGGVEDTLSKYGLGGLFGKPQGPKANLLGADDNELTELLYALQQGGR